MKNFALIGAAGYIAPRHMKAIMDTGNRIIAAIDKNDSVGIIDDYFPEADFFTEFERFDRHVEKLRHLGDEHKVDFVSIVSPNYLHDAHIRFALRAGADAICEKPVVLNPWNIDALKNCEREFGKRVYTILQLRHHPLLKKLKAQVDNENTSCLHDIELTYITGRGRWYFYSWKGDEAKSGGIATNIGIHLFDMLIWIFGQVKDIVVHVNAKDVSSGYLLLEKARVNWYLSLKVGDVPQEAISRGQRTYRSLTIDGNLIDFSAGFGDLHTVSYRNILNGYGFDLDENRNAVDAVYKIRHISSNPSKGNKHPFLLRSIS